MLIRTPPPPHCLFGTLEYANITCIFVDYQKSFMQGRVVFRTHSNICSGAIGNSYRFKLSKKVHLRCLTGFWIRFSEHKKWSFPLQISSDFFSFLRIWSHLLKKSLMENFIFCAVFARWIEREWQWISSIFNINEWNIFFVKYPISSTFIQILCHHICWIISRHDLRW